MSVSSRILSRSRQERSTLESRRDCSFMPFRYTDDHLARRDSTGWEIHVLRMYRGTCSDNPCASFYLVRCIIHTCEQHSATMHANFTSKIPVALRIHLWVGL